MKIIPPYQITSEILNLINETEEYIILVSPYVNLNNWDRIKVDITNAIKRGVKIQFYTRLDSDNYKSWEQIEQLGLKPKLIKNLHAKVYFNEKSGIVTSMNLLTSSNLSAIEFGSIYHTEQELNELQGFIKRYLEPNIESTKPNEEDIYLAKEQFTVILSNYLANKFNRRVNTRWRNGAIEFNVKNQYYFDVDKGNNLVSIGGIISGLEHDKFDNFKKKYKFNEFQVFVNHSNIYIESGFKLSNSNLNFISVSEKRKLLETTAKFVENLTKYKRMCYENEKADQ
ncbi:phospholipase D-like domain-containing protein [Labilibaculum manganireducens]|uniref:phospholipase D-like domain-containing protein n=1 Tax=Labilibaculum manganireducens TaxID=1940525 RepID=UPI0029F50869|nr:phospholipase D-like domain-containing protein [Labilibaculum manganireducens]